MCSQSRCGSRCIDAIEGSADGSEFDDFLLVTRRHGYGRFCVETGRLSEAEPWLRRAGARAQSAGMGTSNGQNTIGAGGGVLVGRRPRRRAEQPGLGSLPGRSQRATPGRTTCRGAGCISASPAWRSRRWTPPTSAAGTPSGIGGKLGKPLHIHRILLQRSWIEIFRGDFAARQADRRRAADGCSTRGSTITSIRWRADALTDLVSTVRATRRTSAGGRSAAGRLGVRRQVTRERRA